MMEKIDEFVNENQNTIEEFHEEKFNVSTVIKQARSILESPDTIWHSDRINFRMEFFISKDIFILIVVALYNVAVFLLIHIMLELN